jgi:hypothetical protein
MYTVALGQLYNPAVTTWPEIPIYDYRLGNHRVVIPLAQPAPGQGQGNGPAAPRIGGDQRHP